MAARNLCERWASRRQLNSFGFTPRSFAAVRRLARFRGQRSVVPGYFWRRILPASSAPFMFSDGKRCK